MGSWRLGGEDRPDLRKTIYNIGMNADPYQLSSREKEVAELLLQGKSNKEIALALGVSVSTVEFHLKNVYRKLGVKSRTEAILLLGVSTGGAESGGPGQSIGDAGEKPRESIVDGTGRNAENGGNSIPRQVIPMKQKFFVVGAVVVFVLLTGAVLTRFRSSGGGLPLSQPSEAVVPASPLMSEMGTSFIFPPGLGDGTENEVVPAASGYATFPQHIRISLVDYPLQGQDTLHTPQIEVFPAAEYRALHACIEAEMSGLENILSTQNASLPVQSTCAFSPDALPMLPDQHAAQVFHALEKTLPFQNGSGVRYITQYSQAHFPAVDNKELFYTFQGLTSDGKYYVSVVLPVRLEALDNMPTPQSAEQSANDFQSARNQLQESSASIQPSLEALDALVQSLTVGIQQ
jgi:DNA-binding CsgD family transcriptional regulator